jgi:hypothetical protein
MKVSWQISHAEAASQVVSLIRAARLQRVRANGRLRDQNLRRMVERWAARRYPRFDAGRVTGWLFSLAS